MIRAFLAIELPEVLRVGLAQVQEELKRSRADVRWVPVGNIHLTLKFFGNVPDDEIEALAAAARQAAAEAAPLELQATGAGAFPSPTAPRVVWLGLGGDLLPLTQLFYRLEKAFAALGYPPEGRAFNPHLTLGRVKSPANRDKLARLLEKLPPLSWPPFTVEELILFQSVLSPQGSKYTPLEVIKLGEKET
jgi:RNA 2',3'-cyclic 3'-phosphodiesterase